MLGPHWPPPADHPFYPAERLIRREIRRHGPITFARFMELALYAPRYGYYETPRPKTGPSGDFDTSQDVHPLFGALLARWLVGVWEQLDRPAAFTVWEWGPGNGLLARDILMQTRRWQPDLWRALDYRLVERSEALRTRQRVALFEAGLGMAPLRWVAPDDVAQAPPAPGALIANELLDAFPVHRVHMTPEGPREYYITYEGRWFVEHLGPLSTPAMADELRQAGVELPPGYRTEINLGLIDWVRQALAPLERGAALVLDYGEDTPDYFGPDHSAGRIRCYTQHQVHDQPLANTGMQDITAHVDFGAVQRAARDLDWTAAPGITQAAWLHHLGADDALRTMEMLSLPQEAHWRNRQAIEALTRSPGLGDFYVQALHRGLPGTLVVPPDGNAWFSVQPERLPLLPTTDGGDWFIPEHLGGDLEDTIDME